MLYSEFFPLMKTEWEDGAVRALSHPGSSERLSYVNALSDPRLRVRVLLE